MASTTPEARLNNYYDEFNDDFARLSDLLTLETRKTSSREADLALVSSIYQRRSSQINWELLQHHWDLASQPPPKLSDSEFAELSRLLMSMRNLGDYHARFFKEQLDAGKLSNELIHRGKQQIKDMSTLALPALVAAIYRRDESRDWPRVLELAKEGRLVMVEFL